MAFVTVEMQLAIVRLRETTMMNWTEIGAAVGVSPYTARYWGQERHITRYRARHNAEPPVPALAYLTHHDGIDAVLTGLPAVERSALWKRRQPVPPRRMHGAVTLAGGVYVPAIGFVRSLAPQSPEA